VYVGRGHRPRLHRSGTGPCAISSTVSPSPATSSGQRKRPVWLPCVPTVDTGGDPRESNELRTWHTPASRTADAQHRRLFSLTRELCPTIPSRPVQRSDSSVAADSVCAVCLRVSSRFIGPCDPVAWRVLACRPKACGVGRVYATSHRHTCTAVQHGRYRRIFDILAPHHRIQGSLFR
jgi:hypothetical protein